MEQMFSFLKRDEVVSLSVVFPNSFVTDEKVYSSEFPHFVSNTKEINISYTGGLSFHLSEKTLLFRKTGKFDERGIRKKQNGITVGRWEG